jgi:hypothetical protein
MYQGLMRSDDLAAFDVSERFYEINSPSGLEETVEYILTLAGKHP